jgi:stage II sporulation protein D
MKKTRIRHINFFMLFFPLIFFLARPPEFGRDTDFFRGYSVPKPAIRIGLGVGLTDITIRSSSGMKIYQVDKDYRLLGQDLAEAQIKGHKEKLTEKFSVQISQARTREEAEKEALSLQPKVGEKVMVVSGSEGGTLGAWRVVVGDFLTRGDALHFISKLNKLGLKDTWIVRDEVTENDSKPFGLLLDKQLIDLDGEAVLYFIPSSSESYLSYNGRSYRGILIIRHTTQGIVLINLLNVDEYLQGVVPCELSPYEFGEIEAQKAQAIAARTYALKNLGRYQDLGFDLDDSPSSQVYKGLDAETELSTRAVQETRGQVALYKKELIDALYTSTCGGMTENVENIFPGPAEPYLRGVECVAEHEEEWTLKSDQAFPPVLWNGLDLTKKMAVLMSLGIIPRRLSPAYFREAAEAGQAVAWARNLLSFLGRSVPAAVPPPEAAPLSHARLASQLISLLGWQDRVKNLLLQSEIDHVLKDFPEIKGPERNDLAYMIISGVFPPLTKSGPSESPVARAELGYILYKVLALNQPAVERGIVRRVNKNELVLVQDGLEKSWPLSSEVFLLRVLDDQPSFTRRLVLEGGERASFIQADGQVKLLEVDYSSPSNVLDKSSPLHRWQVRMSRSELEARVNQFFPVGRLVDILPQDRGVSKRVIALEIVGSEGREKVTGLKIRWVLGLRDTAFVVDRELDEDGRVSYFTFSGRGWGHGVGLCQVGAFRLAQTGHSDTDILKKYYQGITIDKVY